MPQLRRLQKFSFARGDFMLDKNRFFTGVG